MRPMLMLALLTLSAHALGSEPPRDPFAAYEHAQIAPGAGPLQRWPLEVMRLRGLVTNTASPRVLIETPDGQTHVARAGDYVGTAWGRIAAISTSAIAVVERFRDPLGGVHERRAVLALSGQQARAGSRLAPAAPSAR